MGRLRLGARGSRLSRAQTQMVVGLLTRSTVDLEVEVVPITTAGDRLPPGRRGTADGKTAFTGDIDSLLAKGDLDLAVHSMKDLPVDLVDGLEIGATPPRGDPRDAVISLRGERLPELPRGSTVGTSSLRRRAQLLHSRPDLSIVDLHGNVETRLRKMNEMRLDAIVLAAAGLDRLSESSRVTHLLSLEEMVPAPGQAILAVEVRKRDREVARIVQSINDPGTAQEAVCERAFTKSVGGDCFVPVGACARVIGDTLTVSGLIASPDGRTVIRRTLSSGREEAEPLGRRLGKDLLSMGGGEILEGLIR